MADKEIRCTCGKVLLKITPDGKIKAWCKRCKEEIEIDVEIEVEVEPYEPDYKKGNDCSTCRCAGN